MANTKDLIKQAKQRAVKRGGGAPKPTSTILKNAKSKANAAKASNSKSVGVGKSSSISNNLKPAVKIDPSKINQFKPDVLKKQASDKEIADDFAKIFNSYKEKNKAASSTSASTNRPFADNLKKSGKLDPSKINQLKVDGLKKKAGKSGISGNELASAFDDIKYNPKLGKKGKAALGVAGVAGLAYLGSKLMGSDDAKKKSDSKAKDKDKTKAKAETKKDTQKPTNQKAKQEKAKNTQTKKEDTTPKKESFDLDTEVKNVMRGKYGTGAARKAALGDNYAKVQAEINKRMASAKPKSTPAKETPKTVEAPEKMEIRRPGSIDYTGPKELQGVKSPAYSGSGLGAMERAEKEFEEKGFRKGGMVKMKRGGMIKKKFGGVMKTKKR